MPQESRERAIIIVAVGSIACIGYASVPDKLHASNETHSKINRDLRYDFLRKVERAERNSRKLEENSGEKLIT